MLLLVFACALGYMAGSQQCVWGSVYFNLLLFLVTGLYGSLSDSIPGAAPCSWFLSFSCCFVDWAILCSRFSESLPFQVAQSHCEDPHQLCFRRFLCILKQLPFHYCQFQFGKTAFASSPSILLNVISIAIQACLE